MITVKVGDVVKVTDAWGKVEGTVYKTGINPHEFELTVAGQRTLCYYTDNENYTIEKIKPREPKDVASVYTDSEGTYWVKYSNTVFNNWINSLGHKRNWEDLT